MEIENKMVDIRNDLSAGELNLINASSREKTKIKRYKALKEHLCCDLNGTSVILSLASGKYFGVNSVGSFIWSVIQDSKTLDEILDLTMEEFDVEEDVCRKEVLLFLEKMAKQNLIEVSDEKVC